MIGNESTPISEIISKPNQLKTGAPLDFYGKDPLDIFKDGELIDVIRHFDNDKNFAEVQMLRRKHSVTEPSLEYDVDD